MSETIKTVAIKEKRAPEGMVLCAGFTRTGLGGVVRGSADADLSMWKEMTIEEADVLIAENKQRLEEENNAEV